MPRYHFHIVDGVKVFDPKGMALPDVRAAREQAKLAARSFRRSLRSESFKIRVTDERGQVVYETRPEDEG